MKYKTLSIAVIALIICNLFFAYLLWGKKRGRGKDAMLQKFVKEIGLEKAKADSAIAILRTNMEQIKPFRDSLQASREKYIDALLSKNNDSLTIQQLMQRSNTWMLAIDKQRIATMQECKKFCTADQATKLDSLLKERLLMNPKRNNKN